jgi:dihydroneopterin aldolase
VEAAAAAKAQAAVWLADDPRSEIPDRLTLANVPDQIHIEQLELSAHIGVPDEERDDAQRLTVNLTLEPKRSLSDLGDELANTVDYFAVSQAVQELAAARPRRLLETLAEEIAAYILGRFPVVNVHVELRKYILPNTRYVAVRLCRSA